MPLSVYNLTSRSQYREVGKRGDSFHHRFGGDPVAAGFRFSNIPTPPHLLYRLDLTDSQLGIEIPGVKSLPLFYGFAYASMDGTFIYRVVNDLEIEVILPVDAKYDRDFPYTDYPLSFPESSISFEQTKHDPALAEDALKLAAVFGLEQLSPSEWKRAITIADKTSGTIRNWRSGGLLSDWSPEEIVRNTHREPFMQGAPSKCCGNPNCTARIVDRTEELTIEYDEETQRLLGERFLTIEASDVREDSMRVFAIHQPGESDVSLWGDPFVQLVFEICECCNCIRVSNQCS